MVSFENGTSTVAIVVAFRQTDDACAAEAPARYDARLIKGGQFLLTDSVPD